MLLLDEPATDAIDQLAGAIARALGVRLESAPIADLSREAQLIVAAANALDRRRARRAFERATAPVLLVPDRCDFN